MKLTFFLLLSAVVSLHAQKYKAADSKVVFFSKATLENITATNKKSTSLLNTSTDEIVLVIPIADFQFAKPLMQEHFNEKYMESEKFPKATFQGKISGFDSKAPGEQHATAKGKLTIHGVTKDVEIPGTMELVKSTVNLKTKFIIKLADYEIAIPTLMWQKIATEVEVTAEFFYKPI